MEKRLEILGGSKNASKEEVLVNAALTASQVLIDAQNEADRILDAARIKAEELFKHELELARRVKTAKVEEAKQIIADAADHVANNERKAG